ncbi:MAG: GAF domain-containing protein, partial [Nitrososphaerales archaeon]
MPARWSQVEWESAGVSRLSRRCAWLAERLGAERVTVWGYDPWTDTVTPVASRTRDDRSARFDTPCDNTPVDDLPELRRVLAGRARSITSSGGTAMYVRLVTGTPVGVLVVEPATRAVPGRSTLDSMASTLLGLLAARTARRRRADNDFVMDLIADCCNQPDMGEALGAVCERLARRLGARRASVFLTEGGILRPRMSRLADGKHDVTAWKKFRSASEPLSMAQRAARSGTAVRMDSPDPELASEWWQENFGITSAFAVPISSEDAAHGALLVGASEGRRFNQRDVAVAGMVGKHLATVLRVMETHERREADLRAARAVRRLL